MRYTPHTIRYRNKSVQSRDEFGRPLAGGHEWQDGGRCRCDDNSIQDLTDDNGREYKSTYKIVVEGRTDISAGDEVEVYDGENLRAHGVVNNVNRCNYLPYSVIWV